ncbi:MAG: zinc-ribbon domain-containing protein [Lachnospiraceae bacterium]|nr:zinc-ribbon domain-containing protein [Lachnospiraceae bacterium]
MFCAKCGAENMADAKFCEKCGEPLMAVPNAEGVISKSASGSGVTSGQSFVNTLKSVPLKIWIGGGVALVAIIVAIVVLLINATTVDFSKYVVVETSGYNGYGKATVKIDWETLEREHGKDLSFTPEAQYAISSDNPVVVAKRYVKVKAERTSELSNGDVINYEFDVRDDFYKFIGGRVKFSAGTYTVNNLQQAETIDVFKDLNVEFTGTSPNGRAKYTYNGSESISFRIDKRTGLKNGDTITVTLSISNPESFAKKYGKLPAETSKTYTVSGLAEGMTSFSGVSETALAKFKKEAEDKIASQVAGRSNYSVANLEYVGYYFLTKKENSSANNNQLFIVYSGDLSHSEGKFTTTKVFFPVQFTNVLKGDGDEYKYNSNLYIKGNTRLESSYSTNGFKEGAEMYKSIITENRDNYTYEMSEGLKQFGE